MCSPGYGRVCRQWPRSNCEGPPHRTLFVCSHAMSELNPLNNAWGEVRDSDVSAQEASQASARVPTAVLVAAAGAHLRRRVRQGRRAFMRVPHDLQGFAGVHERDEDGMLTALEEREPDPLQSALETGDRKLEGPSPPTAEEIVGTYNVAPSSWPVSSFTIKAEDVVVTDAKVRAFAEGSGGCWRPVHVLACPRVCLPGSLMKACCLEPARHTPKSVPATYLGT